MSIPADILRGDTAAGIKLRWWSRKLGVLLRANAMRMAWQRLRAAGVRAQRHVGPPEALILMYHRVADLPSDPQMLCVTPQHFAEHLVVVQERFKIIPLRELVRRLRAGESIGGTVAITFDDGYADNLYEAKPLLERNGAPATVFVASSYIGGNTEFWWDELERVLLCPQELRRPLHLDVDGRIYACDLGTDSIYDSAAFERNRNWHQARRDTPTRRHALYRTMHRLLCMLSSAEREHVLEQLRKWANLNRAGRATHLPLSEDETISLARGGLVEIGAHTATHPVLSMLPIAEQKDEIEVSKGRLERIVGQPIVSFAYPYGSLSDYQAQTMKAIADLGFESASSTFANVVMNGYDRFQLPRFTMRDWDGPRLRAQLQAWTHQ
jgi:peptidoglycan/xylan/chitin deacetylase (PgdA/CDA1 family)